MTRGLPFVKIKIPYCILYACVYSIVYIKSELQNYLYRINDCMINCIILPSVWVMSHSAHNIILTLLMLYRENCMSR